MAQLNRLLTKSEIEALLNAPALAFHQTFMGMMSGDRWPLMVHYRVGIEDGRPQYTPRDIWRNPGRGPSDCVWIIPGSTP